MQRSIYFRLIGHDPFIDFIKAYAIICVLIGHTFPFLDYIGYGLWAGMQVPLFILVQSFHFLKKEKSNFSITKILWRVLIPFFVAQLVLFILLYVMNPTSLNKLFISFLVSGGKGPGSYYPWIYIQIAFLLPLFKKILSGKSELFLAIFFLLLCEGIEILLSIVNIPDYLYRLLAFRYLFLVFLSWIWIKKGIQINNITIVLSLLSFLSIVYFEYFSFNNEPLFYNTSWKYHRWPCYYYVAFLFTYLLYFIHRRIIRYLYLNQIIVYIAQCSYEIFLVQMVICAIFQLLPTSYDFVLGLVLKFLIVFILSISGGFLLNKYYKRFVNKYIF